MKLPMIALEEHVDTPDTVEDAASHFAPQVWPKFRRLLLDIHGELLSHMDEAGIQTSILSLNAPGIQSITNKKKAVEVARRSNDYLAEQAARNPRRFRVFAGLPMQDPECAALELTRCIRELGFAGALVNSFSELESETSDLYYDLPQYGDFWATLESLDVPLYLHPRYMGKNRPKFLDGHPWFWGPWAFTMDTATHSLRLMASGIFDRFPKLTIILGHLGETLPFTIHRISETIRIVGHSMPAKRPLADYFRENFYVTTSGNFCSQTLLNTILWLGADRVLFSVDYPYQKMAFASEWLEKVDVISEADREKIAFKNAERLFRL